MVKKTEKTTEVIQNAVTNPDRKVLFIKTSYGKFSCRKRRFTLQSFSTIEIYE